MNERRSSFGYEELLECGRGKLFGMGNAQLPLPPMLMFDRIVKIVESGGLHGKGEVIAELDVKPALWFFKCHFPGNPVMPGLDLCAACRVVLQVPFPGRPGDARLPRP